MKQKYRSKDESQQSMTHWNQGNQNQSQYIIECVSWRVLLMTGYIIYYYGILYISGYIVCYTKIQHVNQ